MLDSHRKAIAAQFRQHIRRSNELHHEYLADKDLLKNYDRFTLWQLEYLLPFFRTCMPGKVMNKRSTSR